MIPIGFISDGDPDALQLGQALGATFTVTFMSLPLQREDLERLAPAALVVRIRPGALVSDLSFALQTDDGLPVLALLDPEDVDTAEAPPWEDFALRPWWPLEVIARLRRLLRDQQVPEDPAVVRWGRLTLDAGRHEVRVGANLVDLTYTEFRLLAFLMDRAGRVATREAIFREVWGSEFYGGVRTVDVHIRRLRSKLRGDDCPTIATVRNVGYRLVNPRRAAWPE